MTANALEAAKRLYPQKRKTPAKSMQTHTNARKHPQTPANPCKRSQTPANPYKHPQILANPHKLSQTPTDPCKLSQTPANSHKHPQTLTNTCKRSQTPANARKHPQTLANTPMTHQNHLCTANVARLPAFCGVSSAVSPACSKHYRQHPEVSQAQWVGTSTITQRNGTQRPLALQEAVAKTTATVQFRFIKKISPIIFPALFF